MSPTQSHQPKSPLETRLALEVLRLKEAAKVGHEREALISRAHEIETKSRILLRVLACFNP
jgi:hypothetical protein